MEQLYFDEDLDLSDVPLTFAQLVTKYGCNSEEHHVTTPDGYELTMFRINKGPIGNKAAVFLQHGIFSDSASWIISEERSLAFRLAEQGYDVWTGNNRGVHYSRKKINGNPDGTHAEKAAFFDYSFYELGKYDAPTQIDYALKVSGRSKLSYIGHS